MLRRYLLALVSLLAVLPTAALGRMPATLSPEQAYGGERGEPITFEVDFRAIVTAPYRTKQLRVWLPMPPTDSVQQVTSHSVTTFPQAVEPTFASEPKFGNHFAYFEFNEPKGAQILRHRFAVTTRQVRWNVEPTTVAKVGAWPKAFQSYLDNDAAIAVTPEVQVVLDKFAPDKMGGYTDLTRAMDWIHANLIYDHSTASLQGSSQHAILQRRGHCSDYHGLCSAFGRALQFPTRITYGVALFPNNSPSHCKLEAFLPPYGWVSFDISETQKLIRQIDADTRHTTQEKSKLIAAARERLHRGFREESWLLVTRGSDYELAPPANQRVNVVRTLYAEADGQPLPEPDPSDSTQRKYGWGESKGSGLFVVFREHRPYQRPVEGGT